MEVTGQHFESVALLVSSGGNMLKRSIVNSDMSINSPSWILLIRMLGIGGSLAPNKEADVMLAEWSCVVKSCWPLVPAYLPVSDSPLDDA